MGVGASIGLAALASAASASAAQEVITGTINGPLTVKANQSVKLTSTARINGPVTVAPGGTLDVEGATIVGSLTANEAGPLRLCGAEVWGLLEATKGSGSVVISGSVGGQNTGCPYSVVSGPLTVKENMASVLIDDMVSSRLTVTANKGGTTVTKNAVFGPLTVTGNTGGTTVTHNFVLGSLIATGNSGGIVMENWVWNFS
jgi:hypothetical protein